MSIPGINTAPNNGFAAMNTVDVYPPHGLTGGTWTPVCKTFRWDTRSARTKNPPNSFGWRNPSAYTRECGYVHYPSGTATVRSPSSWRIYYNQLDSLSGGRTAVAPYEAGLASQKLVDRALTQVRTRMKDQKVNLAQAFAERKQTVNLINNAISQVTRSLAALKKGRLKDAARALNLTKHRWRKTPKGSKAPGSPADKRLSSRWLELQYGWKPLLSDVYGAVEALDAEDQGTTKRYICTFRGKASEAWEGVIDRAYNAPSNLNVFQSSRVSTRLRFDMIPDNTFLQSLGSLGVTNPATIAWELTPWSFVIDWFLPIGEYINQLDAGIGWKFLAGTRSDRGFSSGYWLSFNRSNKLGYTQHFANVEQGHFWSLRVVRTLYSSLPSVVAPRFKNPFSGMHVANALALFNGRR